MLMFPDGRCYSVLRFYRPSAHIVFPCISMEKIQSAQRKLAHLKLGVFFFFGQFHSIISSVVLEVLIESVKAGVVFKGK